MPDYKDDQRGPLGGIADVSAAKEIGKLWSVVEGRMAFAGVGNHVLVRREDLSAVELRLTEKINAGSTSPKQTTSSGIGGSITNIGGSGVNLLPLQNTWTDTNTYTVIPIDGKPTVRLLLLNNGPLLPGGPSILLTSGYSAGLDVQRTTNFATEAKTGGGQAGIYVQHRVAGQATVSSVNSGIRVQMETTQTSAAGINDAVSGYFGIRTAGNNVGGFGVHVDAYHASTNFTVMYGVSVEMFRSSLDGKTIGFHARSIFQSGATYNHNDYAFLASPQYSGAPTKWKTVFAAGSNFIGSLYCDVGLDLSYAYCAIAAISVAPYQSIMLNGPATNLGFLFDPIGKIKFFSDVGDTFSIGNNGCLFVEQVTSGNNALSVPDEKGVAWSGGARITANGNAVGMGFGNTNSFTPGSNSIEVERNGTFSINNPNTSADAGALIGFKTERLGGFLRKVPFYAIGVGAMASVVGGGSFNFLGEWDAGATYASGDVVRNGNALYYATSINGPGNDPKEESFKGVQITAELANAVFLSGYMDQRNSHPLPFEGGYVTPDSAFPGQVFSFVVGTAGTFDINIRPTGAGDIQYLACNLYRADDQDVVTPGTPVYLGTGLAAYDEAGGDTVVQNDVSLTAGRHLVTVHQPFGNITTQWGNFEIKVTAGGGGAIIADTRYWDVLVRDEPLHTRSQSGIAADISRANLYITKATDGSDHNDAVTSLLGLGIDPTPALTMDVHVTDGYTYNNKAVLVLDDAPASYSSAITITVNSLLTSTGHTGDNLAAYLEIRGDGANDWSLEPDMVIVGARIPTGITLDMAPPGINEIMRYQMFFPEGDTDPVVFQSLRWT